MLHTPPFNIRHDYLLILHQTLTGNLSHVTSAALPIPISVCSIFVSPNSDTLVIVWDFNVRPNADACSGTRGLRKKKTFRASTAPGFLVPTLCPLSYRGRRTWSKSKGLWRPLDQSRQMTLFADVTDESWTVH